MVINATSKPNMIMVEGKLREAHYNYCDKTWYVEIDGKRVAVDPNDFFGVNKKQESNYFSEQIKHQEERITNYENLIEENKAFYSAAVAKLHNIQNSISTLLGKAGVKDVSELKGQQREEYLQLSNDMSDAKKTKWRSSSNIISYSNSCVSEIISKGNYEQQQIVMNYLV